MRILQLCSATSIGGGERHVADLSNSLANLGHDVYFGIRAGADIEATLSSIPRENISHFRMRNGSDLLSAYKIARFARGINVDVIHAHLARDYPIAAFASRWSGIPFLLTRHVLFPMSRVHRVLLKRVSGVIAPSYAIRDALTHDGIFAHEKIELIRYGVDHNRFEGIQLKGCDNFTATTIGHIHPIKGHDTFVRAAAVILKDRPDMAFAIVGEDKARDGHNRREIETLIASVDLQSKIELVGWLDDVRPAFSRMNVFVSAARAEAFGLVIVEAMMARVPVIATRSDGACEIIEDGITGLLVPVDDPKEMASAIIRLADNESLRKSLVQNAYDRATQDFSRARMVHDTEAFYQRILGTPNPEVVATTDV